MLTSALVKLPENQDPGFEPLDAAFTQLIQYLAPDAHPSVLLAAARVCQAMRQGHSCLDLNTAAGQDLAPSAAMWRNELLACPAVVGRPGETKPLILDGARLYLYRYFAYERQIASQLQRLAHYVPPLDLSRAIPAIAQFLPPSATNLEQRIAAVLPLLGGVTLITGGPGTGKTTTVLRLLALLLHLAPETRVVLAAPTGKAVTRLQESLRAQLHNLPPELAARLPLEHCLTLHRLLKMPQQGSTPRHNAQLPLPWDVVLVDEASMLDLALMAKLGDALAVGTRLILLGDPEQLASVESGNVLSDLSQTHTAYSPARAAQLQALLGETVPAGETARRGLSESSIHLQHSFRFDPKRSIGALAAALRAGDSAAVLALLNGADTPELRWFDPSSASWQDWLSALSAAYAPLLAASEVTSALAAYQRFRVLCAHRQGERGAEGLNFALSGRLHGREPRAWPRGKPIMITANDHALRLFNGDIGLCWPDTDGRARVHFPDPTGHSLRAFLPARLPAREPAYALTVHKSQGSEFDTVALVLPDTLSPVLTRELLYTALTRARQGFWLWGSAALITATVERPLRRHSGLARRLGDFGAEIDQAIEPQ